MKKSSNILFKFSIECKDDVLQNYGKLDNKELSSSVFDLFYVLEESIPIFEINKKQLIKLCEELSDTLISVYENFDCDKKSEIYSFSLPIELNGIKKNGANGHNEKIFPLLNHNDMQWVKIVESAVFEKIIKQNKTWITIADDLKMSQKKLRLKIKNITGLSLIEFQNKIQFELASKLLSSKEELNISEISKLVGFRDVKYFSKKFKKYYGILPSEYKD